jgi:hypothetical protein
MIPWTFSIAYRRFNQGILIRFGHSYTIGIGTAVRLATDIIVLIIGLIIQTIPGIIIATTGVALGVINEAIYVYLVSRSVIKQNLFSVSQTTQILTRKSFLKFYIPLSLTSLISLLANPIGSAAISRMPNALASLAVWPALTGVILMSKSFGIAFNEVVIALVDIPKSSQKLKQFSILLAVINTIILFLVAATPIADFWFSKLSGLSPFLSEMARISLWIALPLPALSVFQSWFQGTILYGRKTRSIAEAVIVYLIISTAILFIGIEIGKIPGIYFSVFALTIGTIAQISWLFIKSKKIRHEIVQRDYRPG